MRLQSEGNELNWTAELRVNFSSVQSISVALVTRP